MGRLIDADALIEEAKEGHVDDFMYVYGLVNRQPTAYNVEAVVNVVREAGAKLCCNKSCNNNCDCCVVDDALRTIIEAIRKGGVR